jgi:hypothetical protein
MPSLIAPTIAFSAAIPAATLTLSIIPVMSLITPIQAWSLSVP